MSVIRPPYSHSIVHVNAGEVMSETLLQKLCTEFSSYCGLIVREPDKMEIEKFLDMGDDKARFALLSKINNNTKKYPRQFTFGQCPPEFDEDEAQPWVPIRDSKKNPLLAVSVEGDFLDRTSTEGFSEAYVLMHEYLGPKLEEIYALGGNSPSKLYDYIKSDSFAKDLKAQYGHRAAFAFMPTVGEPLLLGNFREEGKGGSSYSWGSCSFNLGYTEAVVAAATPVKEATMPKNPTKTSKYADDAPPADPQALPVKPSGPTVIPASPTNPVEKVAEEIAGEDSVKWAPPANIRGKGLKKSYRDMLGYLPENWQQRPSFMLKAKDTVGSLAELNQTKAKDNAVAAVKDMKQEAPKAVLPVIDGKQQTKAVDFIKKHLGDGSAVIIDPLTAQKQESNLAVFSELCLKSNSLDEVEGWPVSGIFAFVKDNPEVAALALIEYRRDRINRKASIKDGEKTLGELTGSGTAPAVSPTAPIPSPEPAKIAPAAPEPRRAASGASKYS